MTDISNIENPIEVVLEGYKTSLIIKQINDSYELNFQCSHDFEMNNEIIINFPKEVKLLKEYLEKTFSQSPRFSILDKTQLVEIDIGFAEEQEYYIYFALVDYNLEDFSTSTIKLFNYKIEVDRTNRSYEQFKLLMELISKINMKKVSDNDEYQPDTIKHPRKSRF